MKFFRTVLILAGFLLTCAFSRAQDPLTSVKPGKNIFKTNLSAAALSHYSFQYERVTNKKQSFAMGFGFSPGVDLPFKKDLADKFGGNADAARAIETTRFTKITITPEYRFYVGKKQAPEGFYIAPFARYVYMDLSQDYTFTPSTGTLHLAHIDGKLGGVGGGLLIGAQWLLGKQKRVSIDWWIAGAFVGAFTEGRFHGTDPKMNELEADDRAKLENDIESVDIPLWDVDATIGDLFIDAKLKGTFYGARVMGICIGIRF
ncbi:MAG: DUF3575 domain-containing protein [Chitinophagaceae bacterium]